MHAVKAMEEEAEDDTRRAGEGVSVLIFRLGAEWLAFRTQTVAEVTTPRPVHRVPHRSNQVFAGLVNLQGQVQLCVSLHGLLGVDRSGVRHAGLVVLRDRDRAETWAFGADEVLGVHTCRAASGAASRRPWSIRPSASARRSCPGTGRSIGLLDEQRVFAALRSLGP